MHRRTYLYGLVPLLPGLSGCMGIGPDSDPSVVSTTITDRREPESPFTLSVETVRKHITDQQPGRIRLMVANTGESKASYETGPPKPFGIVGPTSPGGDIQLWTEAYEESICIDTDGRRIDGSCDMGPPVVTLHPGEMRSETYEIRAKRGTYTVHLEIDGGEYEIEISVE